MKVDHFYKHKNGIDAFIKIAGKLWDTDEGTSYIGYWMVQGIYDYGAATDLTPIWISNEEKFNWSEYSPIVVDTPA